MCQGQDRERERLQQEEREQGKQQARMEQKKETLLRGETGTEHGQSWKSRPFSPLRITSSTSKTIRVELHSTAARTHPVQRGDACTDCSD